MQRAPSHEDRILTRGLLLRFSGIAAASLGFFLPFAVVPQFAAQSAGPGTAGSANTALLIATVVAELGSPRLLVRFGDRTGLAIGLVLMSLPILALTWSGNAGTILMVSATRGIGFGLVVVAGGSLTAALLPLNRRGQSLGLVGLFSGVPGILGLPAGVWIANHHGYPPVFWITAIVPLTAIVTVPFLPKGGSQALRRPLAEGATTAHIGVGQGLKSRWLVAPSAIFGTTALATGALTTFLPLATATEAAWVAPTGLLLHSLSATVTKLFVGRLGDNRGHRTLVPPGLLLSAVGMTAAAVTGAPAVVVVGAFVFGAGFGMVQNATMALMLDESDPPEYATVSAIWNASYDGGMGIGALVAGMLVPALGYGLTFFVVATPMACALAVRVPTRHGAPFPESVAD